MGLGLSALAAIVVLLPGFAFIIGLGRISSPSAPSTFLDQHVSVGLVLSVVAALLAHTLALPFAAIAAAIFGLGEPDPTKALPLLAGNVQVGNGQADSNALGDHPLAVAIYFSTVTICSWLLGRTVARLFPVARPGWHQLLRPAEDNVDFVVLTVDGQIDGVCYLFTGIVSDFFIDGSGRLVRVTLSYAARRAFSGPESKIPRGHYLGDGWVEIPGEFLVLSLSETATVNVDYFYIDEAPAETEGDTAQLMLTFDGDGSK